MNAGSAHGIDPTRFDCPKCGAIEGNGVVRPPDADRLRDHADDLVDLADAIESEHPIAKALRD